MNSYLYAKRLQNIISAKLNQSFRNQYLFIFIDGSLSLGMLFSIFSTGLCVQCQSNWLNAPCFIYIIPFLSSSLDFFSTMFTCLKCPIFFQSHLSSRRKRLQHFPPQYSTWTKHIAHIVNADSMNINIEIIRFVFFFYHFDEFNFNIFPFRFFFYKEHIAITCGAAEFSGKMPPVSCWK